MSHTEEVKRFAIMVKLALDKQATENSDRMPALLLPIESVQDVLVDVRIMHDIEDNELALLINGDFSVKNNLTGKVSYPMLYNKKLFKSKKPLDLNAYFIAMEEIQQTVGKLRFCMMEGHFVEHTTVFPIKDFEAIFSKLDCEKSYSNCSVCFEPCGTKTACNHALCYRCWGKLPRIRKETCSEDCVCTYRSCPLCREDVCGK